MFSQAVTCTDDEWWCSQVLDRTGNETLARAADVLIGVPLALLGLLLVGLVVRWLLHRLVDRLVNRAEDGVLPTRVPRFSRGRSSKAEQEVAARDSITQARRVQRAQTMGSLLKSIVTGLLIAIVGTMMLSEVGVNIAPIIASAGIVGLALGFGALFALTYFLGGGWLIRAFIADPEARRAALDFLPFCAAVPIIGVAAWQLDGLFLGTTQGRALRTAGLISAALYLATDMALRPVWGNAGVWTAFLLMYVYRAAALGWFMPGLFRGLSRPPVPAA